MSSILLSLSSKPFLGKLALRCHTLQPLSSSTTTNPYLMYCVTYCGENVSYDGKEYPVAGAMTKLRMYDPAKEYYFTVGDKPLPKEMVLSSLVGSSHGWRVFLGPHNSTVISDYWNPSSSKSNPKMIHLPPRPDLNKTGLVSSVAMSSSPEEDDCVTAVKFTGRQAGIYKPGLEDMLILTPKLFSYFDKGKLMYSKRDQRFYMPSSGGHHLCSFSAAESTTPQYHDLRFHNLPQFSLSELLLIALSGRTEFLVESPSGQRFLVKWYDKDPGTKSYVKDPVTKRVKYNFLGPERFIVFREEEDMKMCYTEDIGDLCKFPGNNEPFCIKASSSPGLNPNSIYYVGEGYDECLGVYDIATRTPRNFNPKSISAFSDLSTNGEGQVYMVRDWVPPVPL